MHTRQVAAVVLACGLAISFAAPARAQESQGTPAAKAHVEKGKAAQKAKNATLARAAFLKAIELDPAWTEAHQLFVRSWETYGDDEAAKARRASVEAAYQRLLKKHPKSAGYLWGMSSFLFYTDAGRCEAFARRAIDADPRFAPAYQELWLLADMKGDAASAREFIRKAAEASPEDPSYAFYYANSFENADPARYTALALDLVRRFPTHERGAQALYWLGVRAPDDATRIEYLERLRREYPPATFSWSMSGMEQLFDAYARTGPDKALGLAREVASLATDPDDKKTWDGHAAVQDKVVQARARLAAGQAAEAVSLLDTVTPPKYSDQVPLQLLKAEAQASAGDPGKAYEMLAALVAAEPKPALVAALEQYGAQAGRASDDIRGDLRQRREKEARAAPAFENESYVDGRKVSLASQRGRVFVLNFWYPG